MKAIIIKDEDAKALVASLELDKLRMPQNMFCNRTAQIHNISAEAQKAMVEEIHSSFHYVVVRWLQEQGASTTR